MGVSLTKTTLVFQRHPRARVDQKKTTANAFSVKTFNVTNSCNFIGNICIKCDKINLNMRGL